MKIEPIRSPATKTVLYRALTAHVLAEERKCDVASAVKAAYADQPAVMIAALDLRSFISKATTNPAMTTVAGWAAELTGRKIVGPIAALSAPVSAYSNLAERGVAISLDGVGSVALPRHPPGIMAGIFVGEGTPIPVIQLTGTPGTVVPYKAGAITFMTGELGRYGVASIEQLLQQALANDIALSIDAALFSANAAAPSSPAGLLNGVTVTPPTTGGSPSENFAGDLGSLAGAISYPLDLVYIVSTADLPRAQVYMGGASDSLIASAAIPAHQMIALDASDFFAAEDSGSFDISVSKEATLVSRTDPVPVTAAGGARGAPTLSAFQMDLIMVRCLSDLTFGTARTGRVAFTTGCEW